VRLAEAARPEDAPRPSTIEHGKIRLLETINACGSITAA
jgi:molybdenum-dependent DNA-binding transcriptional regulator ModE